MRRSGLAMLVVALAAACGSAAPPTTSRTASVSAAPPSPASTARPSIAASATPSLSSTAPTAPPTVAATVTPPATAAPLPATAAPLPVVTPGAVLFVGAAAAGHEGRLGSYTFQQLAVDAPWLPSRMLQSVSANADSTLLVRFADGSLIGNRSIAYAAAADTEGVTRYNLGASEQTPVGSPDVVFQAPPPGDWVVAAHLFYPAELGSGVYYWHLTVSS